VKNASKQARSLGRHLWQPAPEIELGAEQNVRTSVGADEHEAADQVTVPKRQLLRDGAPHREAGDVGARNPERAQQRGGIVGHRGRRERSLGRGRSARPRMSKAVRR
jgi:hypothetical protein